MQKENEHLKERDSGKPDEQQGCYRKYIVTRTDGDPTGKHADCEYFVLDLKHDPFARQALVTYAHCCAVSHPELSLDLIERHNLHDLITWQDKDDQWSEAIKASHVTKTKYYQAYDQALTMVGNRKSKYALVDLVCWLLQRLDARDKT